MLYVLKHLRTQNLPWKAYDTKLDEGQTEILRLKREYFENPYELFNDMPVEYAKMMEYIRRAPTDEHIDYRYLENLLY